MRVVCVCRRSSEVQVLASKSTCLRVARSTYACMRVAGSMSAYNHYRVGRQCVNVSLSRVCAISGRLHERTTESTEHRRCTRPSRRSPPPTLSITSRINGQAVKHRAGPRPASRHKAQRARPMAAAARRSAHTDCRLGNCHVTPFSKEISPGSRASIRGSWHPGRLAARSAAREMGG